MSLVQVEMEAEVEKEHRDCVDGMIHNFPDLQAVVPTSYVYHICVYTKEVNGFKATLRLPFSDKHECLQWKSDLEGNTLSTFRVLKTFPRCQHKLVYKVTYHCQHSNIRKSKHSKKGRDCKATLEFTVKKVFTNSKSKDNHLPHLPCIIKLYWTHNHDFTSDEMLKYRDVADTTREELLTLLRQGHIAPTALKELKYRLKLRLGKEYEKIAMDRHYVPDMEYVKRLQREMYGKGYKQPLSDVLAKFYEHIHSHTKKHPNTVATNQNNDGHLVVAIVTRFMKRVSYLVTESGNILLVKSNNLKNRYGCCVYLLLTLSCVGGLPTGCIITTSDVFTTIAEGLQLYLSLLDKNKSFFGQGYPKLIMAEDSSSESEALKLVFPQSTHLMSTYHILNSAWKMLFGRKKCEIAKQQLPCMITMLKEMLMSTSLEKIEEFQCKISKLFPSMTTFIGYLYAKKELWGLFYQKAFPLDSLCYSNLRYLDCEMAALSERVLPDINTLNVTEIFDLIVTYVESFYRNKISSVDLSSSKVQVDDEIEVTIPLADVDILNSKMYSVKCQFSSLREFIVNVDLKKCTCFSGFNGFNCEHQAAVAKYFPQAFFQDDVKLIQKPHYPNRYGSKQKEAEAWLNFYEQEEVAKSYEMMESYTNLYCDMHIEETDDLARDFYELGNVNDATDVETDKNAMIKAKAVTEACYVANVKNDIKQIDAKSKRDLKIKSSVRNEKSRKNETMTNSKNRLITTEINKMTSHSSQLVRVKDEDDDDVYTDDHDVDTDDDDYDNDDDDYDPDDDDHDDDDNDANVDDKQDCYDNGDGIMSSVSVKDKDIIENDVMKECNNEFSNRKRKYLMERGVDPEKVLSNFSPNFTNDEKWKVRSERIQANLTKSRDKLNGKVNEISEKKRKKSIRKEKLDISGIDVTISGIEEVCQILSNRVKENPEMFLSPVNSFVSKLISLNADTDLTSALLTFGKENG